MIANNVGNGQTGLPPTDSPQSFVATRCYTTGLGDTQTHYVYVYIYINHASSNIDMGYRDTYLPLNHTPPNPQKRQNTILSNPRKKRKISRIISYWVKMVKNYSTIFKLETFSVACST